MKCKNCGHLNKSNTYYCEKCGSSLESPSAIKQYKQSANNIPQSANVFTKTQKFIIALVIIGILIIVLSAVMPPDLEMPKLASPANTQDEPVKIGDNITEKLNTTIKVGSVSANPQEKVTVNAYVTDQNGDNVNDGTASINLFDIKYSGPVVNGNVNIELPELSENNYETTIVYEGNDKYNPSESKVAIEVNKINTKIEANQTSDDEVIITLKSGNGEVISNAKLIISKEDNTQTEYQTDDKGQVIIKLEEAGKHVLKISYPGDDKYNSTETTVSVGKDKMETKLDTKYNEQDKTITITLTTKDNTPIKDASLKINNNNQESTVNTNDSGKVQIPVNDGENRITIIYEGNDTYKPSETATDIVIEQDNNSTGNNTNNDAENSTGNDTTNDTTNNTNKDNNTDENNTEKAKIDTTFKIENEENQTIVTLLTTDNRAISGENIKIVFDNGRQLTEKTDDKGSIKLNLTDESVKEIELIYEGNDEYNSFNKSLQIISDH